ncbi:sunset domain-containing protein [Devosia sp. A449]
MIRGLVKVLPVLAAAGVGFAGAMLLIVPDAGAGIARATLGSLGGAGCNIKGNISINSGERIYHVPGQRYYLETIIRSEHGERYFCSEAEARVAGWRRAGV